MASTENIESGNNNVKRKYTCLVSDDEEEESDCKIIKEEEDFNRRNLYSIDTTDVQPTTTNNMSINTSPPYHGSNKILVWQPLQSTATGNQSDENIHVEYLETPTNVYESQVMMMLNKLYEQNEEILKRISSLEKENTELKEQLQEKKKKEKKDLIEVPNDLRLHVKGAYKSRLKVPSLQLKDWDTAYGCHAFDETNQKTSTYIKDCVTPLCAHLENKDKVIYHAIKTYFESQRSFERRKHRNPNHGKDCARKQRRIHKCQRRVKGLEKLEISVEEKEDLKMVLLPDMMSSEDEMFDNNDDRYFQTKPLPWVTKGFNKLVRDLDEAYSKTMSQKSKEQFVKRVRGKEASTRPAIKSLKFGFDLFIRK